MLFGCGPYPIDPGPASRSRRRGRPRGQSSPRKTATGHVERDRGQHRLLVAASQHHVDAAEDVRSREQEQQQAVDGEVRHARCGDSDQSRDGIDRQPRRGAGGDGQQDNPGHRGPGVWGHVTRQPLVQHQRHERCDKVGEPGAREAEQDRQWRRQQHKCDGSGDGRQHSLPRPSLAQDQRAHEAGRHGDQGAQADELQRQDSRQPLVSKDGRDHGWRHGHHPALGGDHADGDQHDRVAQNTAKPLVIALQPAEGRKRHPRDDVVEHGCQLPDPPAELHLPDAADTPGEPAEQWRCLLRGVGDQQRRLEAGSESHLTARHGPPEGERGQMAPGQQHQQAPGRRLADDREHEAPGPEVVHRQDHRRRVEHHVLRDLNGRQDAEAQLPEQHRTRHALQPCRDQCQRDHAQLGHEVRANTPEQLRKGRRPEPDNDQQRDPEELLDRPGRSDLLPRGCVVLLDQLRFQPDIPELEQQGHPEDQDREDAEVGGREEARQDDRADGRDAAHEERADAQLHDGVATPACHVHGRDHRGRTTFSQTAARALRPRRPAGPSPSAAPAGSAWRRIPELRHVCARPGRVSLAAAPGAASPACR